MLSKLGHWSMTLSETEEKVVTMPERFIEALDRQTGALDRLTEAFKASHRTGRRLTWLMVFMAVMGLVTLYGVFSTKDVQSNTHHLLKIIGQATSPKQASDNQAQTAKAVALIIVCTNNHTDRDLAVVLRQSVPPRTAGCPPDQLPKTRGG